MKALALRDRWGAEAAERSESLRPNDSTFLFIYILFSLPLWTGPFDGGGPNALFLFRGAAQRPEGWGPGSAGSLLLWPTLSPGYDA